VHAGEEELVKAEQEEDELLNRASVNMQSQLGQAVERVVQGAGELTVEGTKLIFKDKEDEEVQVSVVEFDKEANVT
jgi:F0F1-type ATP synthase membrane subunit b/b'